jgi:LPS export ABC transporter protein LptC
MKNLIMLVAILASFAACDKKADKVQELETEVLAIHDEVMPQMDDIMSLKSQLSKKIQSMDSLQNEGVSSNTTAEARIKAVDLNQRLNESDKLMKTPKSLRYQNETKVFPDTINISFFDSLGTVITRLRSDSGRYDQNLDVYIVKGNVRVVKSVTDEVLTTTELSWSPRTRKVFTEKPLSVINKRTSEVTNAIGMDAEQDFTRIKFRKATGIYKFTGP